MDIDLKYIYILYTGSWDRVVLPIKLFYSAYYNVLVFNYTYVFRLFYYNKIYI